MLKIKHTTCTDLIVIALAFLLVLSCTSRKHDAGTYSSCTLASPNQPEVVIELKEDGQGLWKTPDEEVSFRWTVGGNEIRLHTRDGGIIIGKITDSSLEITLPGKRTFSCKKGQPGA
jgi:hypothetical protein